MKTFKVPQELHQERIDLALFQLMEAYSRSQVQKMIRKELVKINGKTAKKGNRVIEGDLLEVEKMELEESKFGATEIDLDILYEDEDLLVVNKPPGLLSHPSHHEQEKTLVNALLHHCGDSLSGIGGERRPGIVHRLDKDTSGALVVAKHDESHSDLAKQFQDRKTEKHYLTLVQGVMKSPEGTIDAPLLKTRPKRGKTKVVISPNQLAKDSVTHFKVQEVFDDKFSLLDVQIVTGRMHQIRVHLAAIDHPVVGDHDYGNKKTNAHFQELGLKRQFLHAYSLKFQHPRTHEWMEFEAPLSQDLEEVLYVLRAE